MGTKGLFLAPWSLDFHQHNEITLDHIWVKHPHFPLLLWDVQTLNLICDKLESYIGHVGGDSRHFSYVICINLDIKKGLPKAIQLKMGEWSFIRALDYEHLPIKCNLCHAYGYFVKNFPSQDYQIFS